MNGQDEQPHRANLENRYSPLLAGAASGGGRATNDVDIGLVAVFGRTQAYQLGAWSRHPRACSGILIEEMTTQSHIES